MKITKPILKWVGGKTQMIEKIQKEFPKEMNNYREIFLGGGSVLLMLLNANQKNEIIIKGNIYAYDVNEVLIYLFKNIQTRPLELYNEIHLLIEEFKKNPEKQEEYYYEKRKEYNELIKIEKQSIKVSALFLFLNKTCFRGVYRVGPNGFNVPFGHYKNPEIINKEHLLEVHELIQKVIFQTKDFRESFKEIEENDFVYMDPPYVQEKEKSFVQYTENGFDIKSHEALFEMIHELKNQWMMHNSNVSKVKEQFESLPNIKIEVIECKRAIHSKKPDSKANEMIIKNY